MDAGCLRGLAIPLSSCWSSCPHHLPPPAWLKSNSPTLTIFGRGRRKEKKWGAESSIVRAAIAHDIAAVAVAAATVIPMCWLYVNRSHFHIVFQSSGPKSFSETDPLASAGNSLPSNSAVEPNESLVVTHEKLSGLVNGCVLDVRPDEEVLDVKNDPWDSGSLALGADHTPDYLVEELGVSTSELHLGKLEDLLHSSDSDADGTSEMESSLDCTQVDHNCVTDSTLFSPEVEVVSTFPIMNSGLNCAGSTKGEVQVFTGPDEAVNGSLSCSDSLEEVVNGTSVLSDTVDEFLPDDRTAGKADWPGVQRLSGEFEPLVSASDFIWVVEKREELESALSLVNEKGFDLYREVSTSADFSLPTQFPVSLSKKRKVKTTKDCFSPVPKSISEILPLKESAGSELYLKAYMKLLLAGRLQDCVVLLEELEKLKMLDTDKICHLKFFKACQKQKAVREGFRFMRLLSKPTLSTFNLLLSVCREARDVDAGLRVLSATEKAGFKPDFILYTSLISTCAKASKVDVAFKVYHEMETAGVTPSIQTYGAMIDGCAQAGQIAKAFGMYGTMLAKQLKPDHVIFNSLINACGRAGAIDRAFDVLADMRGEPYFLKPNSVTMGALISGCARAGLVERAFEVYKNMHEWGINGTPECYTSLVHACSVTGDLGLALSVFQDMKRNRVKPDEMLFSALIDVAGKSNCVDAAFGILDEMKRISVVPGAITYSALMGVCCNTGNWEKALEVYQTVRAAPFLPTVSTFNALMTALCDAHKLEESLSVLQDMKQAGLQPDVITYSILLDACKKIDEPERAFDLYTSGRADGVVPNESMCASVIAICYATLKRKLTSTSYSCSTGLLAGQSSQAPYKQWASWAIAVYRHAVAASVVPSIKSLSLLLGCLRVPEVQDEINLFDDIFAPPGTPTPRSSSILDGAGLYDPRAFALYEEAALMGVVPNHNLRGGPIGVNAESMPSYVAEVYLVILLKRLKQMHKDGEKMRPITIQFLTETKQTPTSARKLRQVTVSGRTGQALTALLRRVRLHFQGHESSGKLRISTASLQKWLKYTGKSSFAFPFLHRRQELGPPHTFVALGIANQQRAIRMSQFYKNSADIERVSGENSFVDMYGKHMKTSQNNTWDRARSNGLNSIKNRNGFSQRKSTNSSPERRRP